MGLVPAIVISAVHRRSQEFVLGGLRTEHAEFEMRGGGECRKRVLVHFKLEKSNLVMTNLILLCHLSFVICYFCHFLSQLNV